MLRGMPRTRLSTTVDTDQLQRARALLNLPDSQLVDRALALLVRRLDEQRERAALDAAPYEDDPDLAWEADDGPPLPYDGAVPDDVAKLVAQRRATYGTGR